MQSLIADSNNVGKDLSAIVNNPRKYTRPGLLTKLQSMVTAQNDVATRAQLLKPPGKLVGQNQTFVVGMQVRAKGMQQLRQGILQAIDGKSKVTAADLVALSGYFTGPDAYYTDQFYGQALSVLKADEVSGVTVPTSTFFLDSTMFGPLKIQKMLKDIPGSAVGGVHGVGVVSITVKSGSGTQALTPGRNTRVKASADMIFVVSVLNSGTATESGVPVTDASPSRGRATPTRSARGHRRHRAEQDAGRHHHRFRHPLRRVSKKVTAKVPPARCRTRRTNNNATHQLLLSSSRRRRPCATSPRT